MRGILPSVLQAPEVARRLPSAAGRNGHRLLSYVIPIDYTMQGMIVLRAHGPRNRPANRREEAYNVARDREAESRDRQMRIESRSLLVKEEL